MTSMELSQEQMNIAKARYIKQCEYNRNYYRNRYHNDEEFRERRCQISKKYEDNNKQRKQEYYLKNAERIKMKQKINYYRKKGRLEEFVEKHHELLEKLNIQV